jgi:hypothetical protein
MPGERPVILLLAGSGSIGPAFREFLERRRIERASVPRRTLTFRTAPFQAITAGPTCRPVTPA